MPQRHSSSRLEKKLLLRRLLPPRISCIHRSRQMSYDTDVDTYRQASFHSDSPFYRLDLSDLPFSDLIFRAHLFQTHLSYSTSHTRLFQIHLFQTQLFRLAFSYSTFQTRSFPTRLLSDSTPPTWYSTLDSIHDERSWSDPLFRTRLMLFLNNSFPTQTLKARSVVLICPPYILLSPRTKNRYWKA